MVLHKNIIVVYYLYVVYHPEVVFCVILCVDLTFVLLAIYYITHTHGLVQHAIIVLELLSQSDSVIVSRMNL